ncbi:MAG: SpaA isopeptide-forming pilin-related protein [Peptoniphilus harei]|uniref:SpaA isopeptide-forming pilin-related protein n=1 Tax=Peptoniphilus harei TaxID=54005 RepID=UPI00254F1FB5|nr:SpaA isopeptide-forming pilin-related protein [Peptoniphilus harei]MDK7754482.1 SpaA isopeptide-forming pilin-related protein [Peptoniphilus harei]MDK7760288.1 SpaA isopeptide-forming pilin-related protein [Peptoniphilus harei]MDK8270078.1 SpaA isopeptide-forming pilin-related protein [Peptoniphilus harei]MDK8338537.1 SpaA isopeptide-forming pilin-related protein [Peptoniphilus harei]
MDNIFKRFTCLLLAFLMVMEVFSPVAALAASLIDEPESQNSTRIEENISGELFNKPAAKAEKTDTRNKEEVHKKTSNKAKDTGKAPDLIPAKKTKNDHESMNPAKQAKNDYEILVPAKEKAKPEAKAAEEAKAKEEQAAKEKAELDKIEKEKQEALRIEAERQAQAARANDAEAAAAEAEYRDAHQKRLELEQLLEEKLKEKGLRDQKKQSEKSLNAEESNKLKNTNKEEITEEEEEGFLDKVKNFFTGDADIARMKAEFRAQIPTEQNQEEIDAGLIMVQPFDKQEEEAPKRASFRSAFRSMAFWIDNSEEDENSGLEISDEELPGAVGAGRELTDQEKTNLANKKFTVMTRFETSNVLGPIQPGQFFNIHLDKKLTVKDPSSLEPVRYNGEIIASPTYNAKDNIIEYKIVKEIPNNIKVPLNIPVDYNTSNITLDNNGEFVVTNRVSGLGVKAPKDLIPQKVDKNGNLAGSIIEPGRGDVPELIEADDKSYKVDMDAYGTPDVVDGVLKGFNWTAQVMSTRNLNGIDFSVNFTTVKGSGLGKIEKLAIDGISINPESNNLTGKLGIEDSVHYKPAQKDGNKFTYTFYTPVTEKQETYMLDINAVANGKVGAKRIVGTQGYPRDKVADATPNRVGMNNRTSILGEFAKSNQAKWTVTDQVSTGDDGKLPLASRQLSGNQTLNSGQVAVYGIDKETGKMVQIGTVENLGAIPTEGTTPSPEKPVGTIAAYEYTTNITEDKNPLTLGGVAISKYEDLSIDQNWGLDTGAKMPAQTIKAVDAGGNELGKVDVSAAKNDSSTRRITIPNVKVWTIADDGKATKVQPKVVQDLPKEDTIDGKNFQYLENYNYYEPSRHEYYVHNRAVAKTQKKFGKFILNKTDADGNPLEGATFRLFPGPEVLTDKDGKATFSNVEPGTYTLMEVKAPAGYKPADDTTIVVDDNGVVRAAGDDASQEDDKTATKYYEDDRYPAFMNVKSYAKGKKDDTMTTYIYLKPTKGGGTNQNTRLDIVGYDNNNGLSVEVFDVSPGQRDAVSEAMDLQNSPEKKAGGNVLGSVHRNAITGGPNTFDSFTQRTGYQIKFPYQRFDGDWGFLVKITGRNNSSDGTVSYDWLTENNPGNNAKIQKAIYPVDPSKTSSNTGGSAGKTKDTIVTIKNEKFKTSPIEVTKVTTDKEKLGKATFVLKDSDNNILKTVTSISTEGEDKGKVNFGQMPPGHYVIEEVASPDGYIESQLVFDVVVDNANQVTYSARFKDGKGTPVQGVDYWIENEEIADEDTRVPVTTVNQKMYISENNPGEIGTQDGVWEAYRYESLNYEAKITTSKAKPGGRLTIQFDPNLDFTQYVNEIPKIIDNGEVIAKPYFNYDSNTLTYVFTDKAKGGKLNFNLKIVGIIPSKFYAKNSGTYYFTNVVAPGQKNVQGNQKDENIEIKAFYDDYDSARDGSQPTQMYYFRDVYKEGDQWYVKALAYYNPKANAQGSRRNARTLSFNWMTTDWFPNKQIARWEGYGQKPAYELDDLKVYRVLPVPTGFKNFVTNEPNMPRSMGIIPENDPNTYNLVYSQKIKPNESLYDRQGNISVTYDPSKIISSGGVNTSLPLSVSMPQISSANEGYVIEQTFKVTDLDKFRSKFRTFYMTNGNLESAFASKVNLNESAASQAGKEIPKYYKQKIMMANEKYVPAKFSIKKFSEADKKLLAGAVFTLTDKSGKAVSRTTGTDGILTFDNLKPGEYTLKETTAPKDYNLVEKTWNINVSKDGYVTIREISFDGQGDYLVGDNLTLDVSNRPTGTDFKVYKKDDTNQPLQGAEFTLTKDGALVKKVKSDPNGVVSFEKLSKGTYILEETNPPAGFKKLDKKWVVEVGDNNKAKVYEYKDPDATRPPEKENTDATKSLFGKDGTKWVDVAHRPLTGWSLDDNRWGGYTGNNHQPYKMGTRILGINKGQKYVIQRYVINPEGGAMDLNSAVIHREKPQYNNMTWYAGNEEIKAFILDKPVTGNVEDIRLQDFGITELNIGGLNPDITTGKVQYSGGQNRLSLQFTDNGKTKIGNHPIVIDVKVPYDSPNAGVGTGMDLYADGTVYWKSDYYESVSYIVEGKDVKEKQDDPATPNIKGDHVSDGSLDVTNERERHNFKFKKVDQDKDTDAVTGATFKLQGPKIDDNNLGDEFWAHSGTDGIVNFDNLVPGVYKLTETGPAQGYEPSHTDWTVFVKKDGKVYIRDNNSSTGGQTNPDTQWQKVSPNGKEINKTFANLPNNPPKVATQIVEVNKKLNKFRQVFIINGNPEDLKNTYFELHAQEEKRSLNDTNVRIVSLKEIGANYKPADIKNPGTAVTYGKEIINRNGFERLRIKPNVAGPEHRLALTIEGDIPYSGTIGTGLDFYNYGSYDQNNKYNGNHYWAAESYKTLADMTLLAADPSSTGKSRSVYVGDALASTSARASLYTAKAQEVNVANALLKPELVTSPSSVVDNIAMANAKRNIIKLANEEALATSGLEMSNNLVSAPVGAGQDWEAVDPNNSDSPTTRNDNPEKIQTKITDINKNDGKIRQVFLVNKENIKMIKARLDFHAQPKNMNVIGPGVNANNYPVNLNIVSVRPVSTNSTLDNPNYTGGELPYKSANYNELTYWRNQLTLDNNNYQSPFVVVVEFEYQKSGAIGLGADYQPNRGDANKKYWAAESYTTGPAGINKNQPKITYEYGSESTEIPIVDYSNDPSKYVKDPNLEKGKYRIEEGTIGNKRTYYKYELKDGVRTGNKEIDTSKGTNGITIINEMVPKLRYIGTKDVASSTVTITFDGNGGKWHMDPQTVTKGLEYELPGCSFVAPDNTKEFDAWLVGGVRKNPGDKITVNDNIIVKAIWKDKAAPQPIEYTITSYSDANGNSVTANLAKATKDTKVDLTVTANSNYSLATIWIEDESGQKIQDVINNTFNMPEKNVHIKATFKPKQQVKSFYVGSEPHGWGNVTVDPTESRNQYAKVGEKVTFTLNPYTGYKATGATVTKNKGGLIDVQFDPSTNKGYFIMPDISPSDAVTVRGVFKEIPAGTREEKYTSTEKIPFKVEKTVDPNLAPGEKKVDQAGKEGSVTYNYTISIEKGTAPDAAYPADWPQDLLATFQAMKQPGDRIAAYARTEVAGSRIGPTTEKVRVGKSNDPIDSYEPQPGDIEVPADDAAEIIKIPNKKQGFVTKLFKRNAIGRPLEGATFSVNKMTDDTYKTRDKSFAPAIGTSDKDGNITFTDQAGNPIALKPGYYTLTEDKAPTGYKKITADWKIQVKDDGGRVYAVYKGPSDTPSSLVNDNKKANAGDKIEKNITVKSRLTDINPENKTFVQRIYIDTRNHSGILNVQITPEHKREEIDRPGLPPVTIKEGVKTAYRSTYKISNAATNKDISDGNFDHILRTYDLSGDDVSMVNTARWRPFDWGFDEDQLNLEPGVYIVEVEGYYDDSIIDKRVTNEVKIDENYKFLNKEGKKDYDSEGKDVTKPTLKDPYDRTDIDTDDLAKLDLHVDLYEGKREFKQLKLDKNGNKTYEVVDKGSYQGGAAQVTNYVKSKNGEDAAKEWSGTQDPKTKYANFVGKKVVYNGKTYVTGKVDPALGEPYLHADTSINLKPIYDSTHEQELPKEGMEIINDEETYNITFSKHGKDDPNWKDNGKEVTENRLEGAIFKLQELAPGGYIDKPGTFVSSAFNGYFGFRGLPPGRYRLMEVKAPAGYKPIKDPILYMTIKYTGDIVDGKTGEITPGRGLVTLEYNKNANGIIKYAPDEHATVQDGKLVDYVTSATAKNMGKIINEKPGKGAVTINKKDGLNNALEGANFKLTRLSSKLQKDPTKPEEGNAGVSYSKESGKDGVVKFEELPIGNYLLEETKSPDGYQNKGQKWYFTVGGKGLDPYAGPVTEKGQDRTSSISIDNQVIEVVKPNADDKTQEGTIKPNSAHVLSIKSNFKLADGMDIKPGDYFKVKLSDYMDLKGIYDKELIDGLDIFAEGIGTIAKADYDYDNGIITYTFTDYANTYDLKNFETSLTGHIRTDKLKYSAKNVPVGIKMNKSADDFQTINVVYELDTASHTDDWGNNLNIASKITKFNPQTGEFEHIIYLNREQNFSNAATLVYKPGTDVVNLHVEEFKIEEKWTRSQYRTDNINLLMPPSFYVKPNNTDFRKPTDDKYSRIVNDANPAELNYNTGDLNWDDTYIIRVTGQIAEGKDRSYYNPKVRIDANNYPVWSAREDYVYEQWNKNLAEGKMEVTAINPKNEIIFKKLDQAGEILPGAIFKLVKYNEDSKEWKDEENSTKTSGQDGLIKYEKLAPGKYGLVETKAPEGYSPIDGHAAEFTVGDDGVITRKVKKPKDQTPVGKNPEDQPKEGKSPINPAGENQGADPGTTPEQPKDTNVDMVEVDEPVGNGPINIINYKDIEFVKVDAEDKTVFLKGAEFEVYKKDDKGKYQPVKETKTKKAEDGSETTEQVTMTVTSDENGKFKPKINKPGDYALKETKAPEGYSKMPGWIREFRLADGKLYTLEKDPIKASHTDSTGGMITSEVLTVDKDKRTFTQRIVINPNHKDFTIPNFQSYLRIFENDWSITPKADGENKGGKVKVALIGKDSTKKISDLKDKDFTKEYSPVIYKPEAGNTRSAYSLKEITGNGQKDGQVTTTDTIVVEYTGALAQGKTKVDQKAEVILNYSIADQVDYSLDWTVLTENKSVYDEYDLTKAVEVENRKAEYPHTGGMGTLIFTLAGLVLMSAAAYVYSRKRGDSYDGEL